MEQNKRITDAHKSLGYFTPMNAFTVLPLALLRNMETPAASVKAQFPDSGFIENVMPLAQDPENMAVSFIEPAQASDIQPEVQEEAAIPSKAMGMIHHLKHTKSSNN